MGKESVKDANQLDPARREQLLRERNFLEEHLERLSPHKGGDHTRHNYPVQGVVERLCRVDSQLGKWHTS